MSTTKHLRLSIDFTIEIADTPPLLPSGVIDPPDPEYDERQARLLEAVKNHAEVLTRWMYDQVASKMYGHTGTYWYDAIMGKEVPFQDILAPAIATLPEEDQAFFNEVIQLEVFEACIDMFMQSFTVTEGPPVISEQCEK